MEGASRTFTRLSLELGGNAPVLIFPDADLESLAKSAVSAKYRNAGQVCVSPQRFLVHESRSQEFAERVVPHVEALTLGDGMDPATEVGPMINVVQRDRVEALVADARGKGVEVLAGGGRPAGRDKGYFYEPTVLAGVRSEMRLAGRRSSGRSCPSRPSMMSTERFAAANRTEYGLAAYVWTESLKTAVRCYEGARVWNGRRQRVGSDVYRSAFSWLET